MSASPARHQIVAGFVEGDAISNAAVHLRDVFRGMGGASEIYAPAGNIASEARGSCRPLEDYAGRPGDLVVYHYGTASLAEQPYLASPARKVLVYHNVTPDSFFRGFDDRLAAELRAGRDGLARVAGASDAVWADSQFNASELTALGVRGAEVLPLPFAPSAMDAPADPAIAQRFAAPLTNILFVGRMAPNKCVEELIGAFGWYHARINPFSRLILVGSDRSSPRYYAMLRMLAGEMDLANVCFETYASPAGLLGYYAKAHVFVTTSRHEGYCLPLVEAMCKQVPVVARAVGGTPEAMGGAGVLFDELAPEELAELIHRICSDPVLRRDVLASQAGRVAALVGRDLAAEVRALLAKMG